MINSLALTANNNAINLKIYHFHTHQRHRIYERLNFCKRETHPPGTHQSMFFPFAKVHEFDGTQNNLNNLHVPVVYPRLCVDWKHMALESNICDLMQISPARCRQAATHDWRTAERLHISLRDTFLGHSPSQMWMPKHTHACKHMVIALCQQIHKPIPGPFHAGACGNRDRKK